MLTLARVAQGLGGAALMSVNTALIRLIYPSAFSRPQGWGSTRFVVAVSSAAGPTIAAAILSMASWQWLFLINVPLGYYRPASGDALSASQHRFSQPG